MTSLRMDLKVCEGCGALWLRMDGTCAVCTAEDVQGRYWTFLLRGRGMRGTEVPDGADCRTPRGKGAFGR